METGHIMLLHSICIGIVIYVIMTNWTNQTLLVSENRSILIASLLLVYMLLFGHGLPSTTINPNL